MTMTAITVPAVVEIPGWTITETNSVSRPNGEARYVRTTCMDDEVSIYHFGDKVWFEFHWADGNRASGETATLARAKAFAVAHGPRARVLPRDIKRYEGRIVEVPL